MAIYFDCPKCNGSFDPAFTHCPVCDPEIVTELESLRQQLAEAQAELASLMGKHNALHINARASRDIVERQAAVIRQMREALRIFIGSKIPVAMCYNSRGYSWSDEYLQSAVLVAEQSLALTDDSDQLLREFATKVREQCAKECEAVEVHDIGHPGTAFKVQEMCIDAIRSGELELP